MLADSNITASDCLNTGGLTRDDLVTDAPVMDEASRRSRDLIRPRTLLDALHERDGDRSTSSRGTCR